MADYAGMLLDTDSPHITERGGWTFTARLETDEMAEQAIAESDDARALAELESGDLAYVMVTVTASRPGPRGEPITLACVGSSPVEYRRAPWDHVAADLRAEIARAETEALGEAEATGLSILRHLCSHMPNGRDHA